MSGALDCGCVWGKHPDYGDIVTEQCAEHAAMAARRPPDPVWNAVAICGCLGDQTEEHDVIVRLCAEHQAKAPELDAGLRQASDYELDHYVREHAGGRRSKRIWGDPAVSRR